MEPVTIEDYVKNRYEPQMEYYRKASAKNQRKYKNYQAVLIVLSALTPVFAALSAIKVSAVNEGFETAIKILVIVVSSIVGIINTVQKTYNYHEIWIIYRTTYEKLKPEINYYNFNVGAYGDSVVNKDTLFVTRIETILDTEHSQWPSIKTTTKS